MSTAIAIVPSPAESTPSDADQLGAEITELCSYIYAAESRLLTLIREFDEKEFWGQQGLCSCAHWLNFKCGIGMNAAREKVRVAHALAALPKISEGFASGKLSYSKVRAMTRIADESNEDYLLMIAEHGTAHHVEKLVSKYRTAKRIQDAEIANEQYNQREVTHYYDHDGSLVIKARLPAEQGALIVKALEMAMDKEFVEVPTDATAETSVESQPIAARRADALAEVAETYLNNNESSGSTADRYQVIVHVGAEPVRDPFLEDGPHVTAETSRRIACDSSLVTTKEDKNGEPLSIGRRSRTIPPPMRRALRARDKGCRFPGCTNTRFVDGHHIKHWADGGETSLDNLVMLCRHHHHLVHEGGFACEKSVEGAPQGHVKITFKDQGERELESSPTMPDVTAIDDVQKWMDREFFEENIGGDTCTAKWHAGERIDWQSAVSALF